MVRWPNPLYLLIFQGKPNEAKFNNPNGISLDVDDFLIVCDAGKCYLEFPEPTIFLREFACDR